MKQQIDPALAARVLEGAPWGVMVTDADGHPSWLNRHLRERMTSADVDALAVRAALTALAAAGELVEVKADDDQAWVLRHHRMPLAEAQRGEVHYFVDADAELALSMERDRLAAEVEALALHDALTGLPNARALMVALEPQVAHSRRYHKPLSVLKIEVQTEGELREPGDRDRITLETSRVLKDQVRWADLVARGEQGEFILALPETSQRAALKLVEKLATRLAAAGSPEAAPALSVRFGVTAWRNGDDAAGLLRRAGEALLAAQSADGGVAAL